MCGIIGYAGTRPTVPILLEGLRRMEYRGYDSAGICVKTVPQAAYRGQEGLPDSQVLTETGNHCAHHKRLIHYHAKRRCSHQPRRRRDYLVSAGDKQARAQTLHAQRNHRTAAGNREHA